ncbi:MAG: hypothetical protein WD645_02025 [Dehalococcoidia bacterium]
MALLILVCLAALALPWPAAAHVAHPDDVELFLGTEGPYAMRIVAVPYVGYLHVTVIFTPDNSGSLPQEPAVGVSATPDAEAGTPVGPVAAQLEPLTSAPEYSATLDAPTEGPWTVFVEVTSVEGDASLALPVALRQPPGVPLSAVLTGLGLLIPVLWLLWGAVRDRRRRRARSGRKR